MAPKPKTGTKSTAAKLETVYIIMMTEFEHHTDEQGRMELADEQAHASLREANTEAAALLAEYGDDIERETDPDSDSIPYSGSTRTIYGENMDSRLVQVKEMSIIYPDPQAKADSESSRPSSEGSGTKAEDTDNSDIEFVKVVTKKRKVEGTLSPL
jgi:hypothetical protein